MTDWTAVARRVADVAPMLGTVVGGPAGAAIGAVIASTLGTESNPKAVLAKLSSDPEALVKMQQLENDERESLRQHALGMAQAELADIQQARTTHKDHWMPSVLTVLLTLMVACVTYGLMTMVVPPDSKEVLFFLVGQLTGAFMTAITFWLGSSRSSVVKTKMLGGE